ncbi:MAG: NAD-dependent epimerase/dehydratase family protein [Magnetovibrionaceae bacterium]
MKRALVTGGSGFLGSHIVDSLAKRGLEVVVFDTKASDWLKPGCEMVEGSILDQGAILAAMDGCDVVYHLAAVADLDEAVQDPVRTAEVNIIGTVRVLEAARTLKLKRFAYASTVYVYSDSGSFYRTSKRACELMIEDYRERYGLPYTILRFGSVYGPRADHHNPVYGLLRQALTKGRIDHPGSGKEIREYIHVKDAAEAAADILAPDFENENILLTGRERMTTREMLEMVREILGGGVELNFRDEHRAGHYVQTPYNYTPKLGKKLQRATYVDLGLGLLDCIQDLDARQGREPETIVLPERDGETS